MCVFPLMKISSLRGAFVRPENNHMYSTENKGPKKCVDFSPLQRYTASCIVCHVCSRPFWKPCMSVSIVCAFSRICARVGTKGSAF